jgi:hypothetical protein
MIDGASGDCQDFTLLLLELMELVFHHHQLRGADVSKVQKVEDDEMKSVGGS